MPPPGERARGGSERRNARLFSSKWECPLFGRTRLHRRRSSRPPAIGRPSTKHSLKNIFPARATANRRQPVRRKKSTSLTICGRDSAHAQRSAPRMSSNITGRKRPSPRTRCRTAATCWWCGWNRESTRARALESNTNSTSSTRPRPQRSRQWRATSPNVLAPSHDDVAAQRVRRDRADFIWPCSYRSDGTDMSPRARTGSPSRARRTTRRCFPPRSVAGNVARPCRPDHWIAGGNWRRSRIAKRVVRRRRVFDVSASARSTRARCGRAHRLWLPARPRRCVSSRFEHYVPSEK